MTTSHAARTYKNVRSPIIPTLRLAKAGKGLDKYKCALNPDVNKIDFCNARSPKKGHNAHGHVDKKTYAAKVIATPSHSR